MSFVDIESDALPQVQPASNIRIPSNDLSELNARKHRCRYEIAEATAEVTFDLRCGLPAVPLIDPADDEHTLPVTFFHLMADGAEHGRCPPDRTADDRRKSSRRARDMPSVARWGACTALLTLRTGWGQVRRARSDRGP